MQRAVAAGRQGGCGDLVHGTSSLNGGVRRRNTRAPGASSRDTGSCPEPEVRICLLSPIANYGFKTGTRIMSLLVSLRLRSSLDSVLQGCANVGIGTLPPLSIA